MINLEQSNGGWIDDNGAVDEQLLAQLAVDLGGSTVPPPPRQDGLFFENAATAAAHMQRQQPTVVPGMLPGTATLQGSLPSMPQPIVGSFGLQCEQQLPPYANSAPTSFGSHLGSHPDPNALVHSLTSMNSMSYVPSTMLQQQPMMQQQPMLMFHSAFGPTGAAAAAAAAAAAVQSQETRPSTSQSPTSSSGGQHMGDESLDMPDTLQGAKKPVNKGALAQKRFRERQKEKMRQSEAQVAELTEKLGQLEVEKARLESRARLLEQVVSLNLTHEAKLHTNREIMVREQEMLLEDLAAFILCLQNARSIARSSSSNSSSPEIGLGLDDLMQFAAMPQQQQDQQPTGLQAPQHPLMQQPQYAQQQQQLGLDMLQQQQQGQQPGMGAGSSSIDSSSRHNGQLTSLTQIIRGWSVHVMTEQVFPQYILCLQQLLSIIGTGSRNSSPSMQTQPPPAAAAAALQQVKQLVLKRREMTDRHALFSHFYWAVWCLNRGEMAVNQLVAPTAEAWSNILDQLSLSKDQVAAVVAARSSLLSELRRVAADWQKVLPTLALQLLQVPREQWHSVAAVQAMVTNLAAEREAVVAFLHTIMDEVLTPLQEGQLEACSYPWCPDLWTISGAAAAVAASSSPAKGSAGNGNRGRGGRKQQQQQQHTAEAQQDEDPMAALAMGTDVLQPLMPFMTAFQLLRQPITAKGAGLRLKRALLLDPFRTVVPADAYPQPSAVEVANMSLLDAHCGTFQTVMPWDWLKVHLPGYGALPGLHFTTATAAFAVPAATLAGGMGVAGGIGVGPAATVAFAAHMPAAPLL